MSDPFLVTYFQIVNEVAQITQDPGPQNLSNLISHAGTITYEVANAFGALSPQTQQIGAALLDLVSAAGTAFGSILSLQSSYSAARTVYEMKGQARTGNELVDSVIAVAAIPQQMVDSLKVLEGLLSGLDPLGTLGISVLAAPLAVLRQALEPIAAVCNAKIEQAVIDWNLNYSKFSSAYMVGGSTTVTATASMVLVIDGTEMQGGCASNVPGATCGPANTTIWGQTIRGWEGATYTLPAIFGPVSVNFHGIDVSMSGWTQNQLSINLKPATNQGSPQACSNSSTYASPLILDLDGDGVEALGLSDRVVMFDIDSDGVAERTGWVSPDDGLLTVDTDGDGRIRSADELFGYGRTDNFFPGFGEPELVALKEFIQYTSGFDRLAAFDANADGVVDARDARFGELRVWRDLNSNGRSDDGELLTLPQAGVASLSVRATHQVEALGENLVTDRSTFVTSSGQTRAVADVWFAFDQRFIDDVAVGGDDAALTALPYVGPLGALHNLHAAMAADAGLRSLVEQLQALGTLADAGPLVERILARWAGADAADPLGRAGYVNGQHLAVMEAIKDTPFVQRFGNSTSPRPFAAGAIENEWDTVHRDLMAELLTQTPLVQAALPELRNVAFIGMGLLEGVDAAAILARLAAAAPGNLLERVGYWYTALRLLDTVSASFNGLTQDGFEALATARLASQGLHLGYDDLLAARLGTAGADVIVLPSTYGDEGEASSAWTPADAAFWAPLQRAVVTGPGDDTVMVGWKTASVFWGPGQGHDRIVLSTELLRVGVTDASAGGLRLRLDPLSRSQVEVIVPATPIDDFVLRLKASGETLTLDTLTTDGYGIANRVLVTFADGVVDLAQVYAEALPGPTSGDDELFQKLEQPLDGGLGNDTLHGAIYAPSTFVFGRGYGQDVIDDQRGNPNLAAANTLRFGANVALGDLVLSRAGPSGGDLVVAIAGTGDTVRIERQFGSVEPVISTFVVAGVEVPAASFHERLLDALPGKTEFHGTDGPATFLLEPGATGRVFHGWGGPDTYRWRSDTLDVDASDALRFTLDDGAFDRSRDELVLFESIESLTVQVLDDRLELTVRRNGDRLTVVQPGGIESYRVSGQSMSYDDLLAAFERQGLIEAGGALVGTFGDDRLDGTAGDDRIYGFGGADTVTGSAGNDSVWGGDGVDVIEGQDGDDLLTLSDDRFGFGGVGETARGGAGADTLQGSPFEDVLEGGPGDDVLIGGYGHDEHVGGPGDDVFEDEYGNDTYRFAAGDGQDLLVDNAFFGQVDVLQLGGGLSAAAATATWVPVPDAGVVGFTAAQLLPYAVRLSWPSGESVTVTSRPSGAPLPGDLSITDGTVTRSLNAIRAALNAPTDAAQVLLTERDAATYAGGRGDDTLWVAHATFTYVFGAGDGHDRIENLWAFNPYPSGCTLQLGGGVTAETLRVSLGGSALTDLILTLPSGDTLTLVDLFHAGTDLIGTSWITLPLIERITFDQGADLEVATLISRLEAGLSGTTATFDGDDTLVLGAAGVYAGGPGNDTYVVTPTTGAVRIVERSLPAFLPVLNLEGGAGPRLDALATADTLQLQLASTGITAAFVGDDLVLTVTATGATITIEGQRAATGVLGRVSPNDLAQLPEAYRDALGPDGLITAAFWALPVLGGDGSSYAERFGSSPLQAAGIATFAFSDGTTLNRNELASRAANGQTAAGDRIATDAAGGMLDGGAGDDTLIGGDGNDVFVLALGTGDDRISDAGGNDRVRFGPGIGPQLVSFTRVGDDGRDLLIEIDGPQRSAMWVTDQFDGDTLEVFDFTGGVTLLAADVRQIVLDQQATGGPDSIDGFDADDRIETGRGDDQVRPGRGDDTVDGGPGRDTVALSGTADDYLVTPVPGGYRVVDRVGQDGEDLLLGVEVLRFLDQRDGGTPSPTEQVLVANVAPTATDLVLAGREDQVLTLRLSDLLAQGHDAQDETLVLQSLSEATGGLVSLVGAQVVFTPAADAVGAAGFRFTLADAAGATASARVQITLSAVNDAPRGDALSLVGREDTPLTLAAVAALAGVVDPEGSALRVASVGGAEHGTVTLDEASGAVTFTPAADHHGLARFELNIVDAAGASLRRTVQVDLAAVADPVVAVGESGIELLNTRPLLLAPAVLLANEINPDGIALSIASVGAAVGGSVELQGGTVRFVPTAGYTGPASFTYSVTGATGTATVAMTVFDPVSVLTGTEAAERLAGGARADSVVGLGGDDTLRGGDGADTLRGGDGLDVLDGGAGNDVIDGGAGVRDAVDYGGAVAVEVDLAQGRGLRGGEADTLIDLEGVLGSDAGDILRGLSGPAALPGETFRGRGGNDTIFGGTGTDTAEFSGNLADYVITRVPGSSDLTVTHRNGGADGTDTLHDVELLLFADRLVAFGPRVEEVARVAFALWTPPIVTSPTLFAKGISFYTNEFAYSFDTLCQAALQYHEETGAALAAKLKASIPGIAYTEQQLVDLMMANGGLESLTGRAAAVRAVALDPATTAQMELLGVFSHGIVATHSFPGDPTPYFSYMGTTG